jgi:hypothetical protein
MQNQPDQTALSMRNDPDGLIMPKARDATAIDDLENASFGFYGGVSSLIEQAPHGDELLLTFVATVKVLSVAISSPLVPGQRASQGCWQLRTRQPQCGDDNRSVFASHY